MNVLGTKITAIESSWGQKAQDQSSGTKVPGYEMSCNNNTGLISVAGVNVYPIKMQLMAFLSRPFGFDLFE